MILNPTQSFQNFKALATNANIQTPADGTSYLELEAHTGAARYPLLRLQNDATPRLELITGLYFGAGSAISAVEGALYYDGAAHKLKVRTAAAWETVSSA